MHVEKNVYDSVIDTLLNIQGKTKDGLNTRQDQVETSMWDQLHPRSAGSWETSETNRYVESWR